MFELVSAGDRVRISLIINIRYMSALHDKIMRQNISVASFHQLAINRRQATNT